MEENGAEHVQTENEVQDDDNDAPFRCLFFFGHEDPAEIIRHVGQRGPEHKEIGQSDRQADHHGNAEHRERVEEERGDNDAHREVQHVPRDQGELNGLDRFARVTFAFEDRDHRQNEIGDADQADQRHQYVGRGHDDRHQILHIPTDREQLDDEEDIKGQMHDIHSDRLCN